MLPFLVRVPLLCICRNRKACLVARTYNLLMSIVAVEYKVYPAAGRIVLPAASVAKPLYRTCKCNDRTFESSRRKRDSS